MVIIPMVIFVDLLIIYLNFRNLPLTLIILADTHCHFRRNDRARDIRH